MHEQAVGQLDSEAALRRAIERQELLLHYQPVISLPSGQIAGFEALVRWQHPERGLLFPAEFLPLAEQAQLIFPLTQWVLREACSLARKWQDQFPAHFPFTIVSVNLTARYLGRQNLVEEIGDLMSANGLAPESLRLDIQESEIMGDPEFVSQALLRLRGCGVKAYIDDFGLGHSSLSLLPSLPVHGLKIDQSFVRKLHGNEKDSALVQSIVSLARNLGLEVIAEGIETAEQLDFLRSVKCQYGQGYYFSQPLDKEKAAALFVQMVPAVNEKKVQIPRLRPFNLFQGLSDDCLAEVAQICDELSVEPGDIIIRQGQVGSAVYLMEEGSVGIYRGESETPQYLIVLQAPTVVGEMAIINPERIRTANVKALGNLRLLALPITSFLTLLRRFPPLRDNLLKLVADRSLR
jgi:EAL domain-containing protein (putative c-di-GMP-specific phosphodiesterase class I)